MTKIKSALGWLFALIPIGLGIIAGATVKLCKYFVAALIEGYEMGIKL